MVEPTEETNALEKESDKNREMIHTLYGRNHDIAIALIKHFHGVEEGSIVIHKEGEYKVTKVRAEHEWYPHNRTSKPWVYAVVLKKDGTWGEREVCLYGDWELKV